MKNNFQKVLLLPIVCLYILLPQNLYGQYNEIGLDLDLFYSFSKNLRSTITNNFASSQGAMISKKVLSNEKVTYSISTGIMEIRNEGVNLEINSPIPTVPYRYYGKEIYFMVIPQATMRLDKWIVRGGIGYAQIIASRYKVNWPAYGFDNIDEGGEGFLDKPHGYKQGSSIPLYVSVGYTLKLPVSKITIGINSFHDPKFYTAYIDYLSLGLFLRCHL